MKRHQVIKSRDKYKSFFNIHSSDLSPCLPKSSKSTVLFNIIVNQKWSHEYKNIPVVEGAGWLKDLYKNIHYSDLAQEDRKYLDELKQWNADEEENRSN